MTGLCRSVSSAVTVGTDIVARCVVVVVSFCITSIRFFIRVIINKTFVVIRSIVAIRMDVRLNLSKVLCGGAVCVACVSGCIGKELPLVLRSRLMLSFIMEVGPSCLDCVRRCCLVVV